MYLELLGSDGAAAPLYQIFPYLYLTKSLPSCLLQRNLFALAIDRGHSLLEILSCVAECTVTPPSHRYLVTPPLSQVVYRDLIEDPAQPRLPASEPDQH